MSLEMLGLFASDNYRKREKGKMSALPDYSEFIFSSRFLAR